MDHEYPGPESHNQKFIIPKIRRPSQPGLEVTRYAEDEATSPQVVEGPSHHLLDAAASPGSSPHPSQRRQRTRGTSSSSNNLPQTAESADPRHHSPHSHSPTGSQAPIAFPYDSHPEVAVKRQLQDFKFEEPPPSPQSRKRLRRILGLPVLWFWILVVALVVVVAIGLAIGLAVGISSS